MNSIVKETLNKLEQCDDFNNRCDYLIEHSEITYLLEYIKELQQENKQLKEELERSIKANVVLDNTNTDYASIIFDLEEELRETIKRWKNNTEEYYKGKVEEDRSILFYIQELKEKYK